MSISAANILGQIKISGDAQIRPRFDIYDRTGANQNKTEDFYYMYRARVNIFADIGEGWFFKSMLSHNGIAFYSIFSAGDYPDVLGIPQNSSKPVSNESSKRATVNFMELNMGNKSEEYGFTLGLFTLGSFNNPIYDLHYYPSKPIDIPYVIFNADGAFGANAYYKTGFGMIGLKGLVEDQKGLKEENPQGIVLKDGNDQYSFELNYSNSINDINFYIASIATLGNDTLPAPISVGAMISASKLLPVTLSIFGGFSYQNNIKTILYQPGYPANKYQAYFARLKANGKIGPGVLIFWTDFCRRTDKLIGGNVNFDFLFFWIQYEFTIHESEKGNFRISPAIRLANVFKDGDVFSKRQKFEINFDVKF